MFNLSELNKEQKEAVVYGKGPMLIIAGAGTGKTTAITNRVVYLIDQNKAKTEEILALTFTDKAAGEMEERVDKLLPYGYTDLWISTFHSFCERVLRDYGLDIGLPTNFKLLDETASWLLIRQNLGRFKLNYYKPLGNPTKFINALVSHFSRCKDQEIFPDNYLNYSEGAKEEKERLKEIAEAYKEYQNLLLEKGFLDFADLINYCLKLFRQRPLILEKYRNQFKYILVDEFQDTNWAQYELVKLLARPRNNLTVCADDDQSIYRWRGASFGNVVQFHKDYPEAKEIVLTQNYRSPQNILDLAYKFIQSNNPNRLEWMNKINKKLLAVKKKEGIIEHLHYKTIEKEVQETMNKIAELLKKDKNAVFSDFAILVRANDAANAFARACERAGLPYQFMAMRGLYSKPIILDIISYFKLLDNYHESSAAYRVLNLPFLGIPVEDIAKITQYSYRRFKSVYEAMKELSLIYGLSPKTVNEVNKILSLVKKHTELSFQKNVSELFLAFLEETGYLKYLVASDPGGSMTRRAEERREDLDFLAQFQSKIKAFEESHIDPRLKNFMEELNWELESGEEGKLNFDPEKGPDMVRLMTIHGAKGLEFKYVFIVNLVDKRFPTNERKEAIEVPQTLIKDIIPEGDVHLEEERRLFYVGMTRAKEGLFFTSADDYGGMRKKKLSRFLTELGYVPISDSPQKSEIEDSRLSAKVGKGKAIETKPRTVRIKKRKEKPTIFLPDHFSFTQLAVFEKCPLQYKFAHILKIPVRSRAVFSFGKTIHNTLFQFLMASFKTEVDIDELFHLYQLSWIDEWYDDKKQREDYFGLGKKALEKFYAKFSRETPLILSINGRPALEQGFNFKIGGYTISGKIDRIDKVGDGVEIIDYKTGLAKEKLRPEDRQQLLIYQIAAEEVFGLKPAKLTYYYLEGERSVSFLGSEKEKKEQKERIISQIEQIKKSNFEPTPGWQCEWCDFKNICDHAQK